MLTSLVLTLSGQFLDKILSTTKTIFVQRNKSIFASIALSLSVFISTCITKSVVKADGILLIVISSIGGGLGCFAAIFLSNKFSKDKTYVNVLMCDDKEVMKKFHEYLASEHITNTIADTYTKDMESKTLTITAYADTKDQSRKIGWYIDNVGTKIKRVEQK